MELLFSTDTTLADTLDHLHFNFYQTWPLRSAALAPHNPFATTGREY